MVISGWNNSNGGKMKFVAFNATLDSKPSPGSQCWWLHSFTFHFQVSCATLRATHSFTSFTFFIDPSFNHHSLSFFKTSTTWRWVNKFSIKKSWPFSEVNGDNSTTFELCYFLCPTCIFHVSWRQVMCLNNAKQTIPCAWYT
jgi:hypothetical protein